MPNFDRAFAFVVGLEGGYVNDPRDPGGETKYGISKRNYPDLDIANLTLDAAKAIYQRDYWAPLGLDERPYGAALCLFDCAVNNGLSTAKAFLHQVATSAEPFIVAFQAERALRDAQLTTFATYGRGWLRRIVKVAIEASKDSSTGDHP